MAQSQKVDLKVVLLGSAAVGKTCLVGRYINERFVGDYDLTIGAAFAAKAVTIGDRTVRLGIWDTAGHERFEAMSRIYYRGAKAAIVCFDVTDKVTFERTLFWINQLQGNEPGTLVYICATKVDLLEGNGVRAVPQSSVNEVAQRVNGKYFETSAKTGQGIDELFQAITEDYIKTSSDEQNDTSSLALLDEQGRQGGCSC
ncbi:hypothetical protein RCL1_000251 [Eukaryota sp. TZLM3-RCL]